VELRFHWFYTPYSNDYNYSIIVWLGMNIENYKYKWGGEDWDLLDRVLMLPVEVERIKHPGLYHHFHSRNGWN